MSIQIGTVRSLSKVENFSINPDDRQELVQLVGGVVVIDGWNGSRNTNGDTYSMTATFDKHSGNTVLGYWNNRTIVSIVLEDGTTMNGRIVVRRITYPDALAYRRGFMVLDFEIWKV